MHMYICIHNIYIYNAYIGNSEARFRAALKHPGRTAESTGKPRRENMSQGEPTQTTRDYYLGAQGSLYLTELTNQW